MSVEREKEEEVVEVFFPESGETIQAKRVRPQDMKKGKRYLLDRDHNANEILEPVSSQSLPKGRWELKE